MKKYKERIADRMLARKLAGKGAVLIEGPKWCGKTTTAEQQAATIVYMDDPVQKEQNIKMADINPKALFIGETPILLDEWQIAPKLWDAVRFEVDHREELGQFILTGSAVPADSDEIHHTGTGRYAWLTMRPMSLYESGESTGEVSIKELFDAPDQILGINKLTLEDLAFLICRGGWPRATTLEGELALDQAKDYYDAVTKSDVSRVDGVRRNTERIKLLMRSYARHQGAQAPISTIAADMKTNDEESADMKTISSYLDALKKIFVVEDSVAWNPNLRSKTAIRTSDTRYFVDPSIAVAALGLGPNDLISDLNTMGLLFETLCVRDLRVFADALDGQIYHFRDKYGLECDAVLHLRNGKFGLIEVKLGGDKLIEEGAATLKTLAGKIDTDKMKSPSFLMVLTGTGKFAFRREDGVYVVPIGCLKD
ncbi:ATP-binding protein [Bacteroides sp.]|uniref:ATP-binding protein n=1 Tax=Bacteroides sp. TaxID=29523 RepID=UPI003AB7CA62